MLIRPRGVALLLAGGALGPGPHLRNAFLFLRLALATGVAVGKQLAAANAVLTVLPVSVPQAGSSEGGARAARFAGRRPPRCVHRHGRRPRNVWLVRVEGRTLTSGEATSRLCSGSSCAALNTVFCSRRAVSVSATLLPPSCSPPLAQLSVLLRMRVALGCNRKREAWMHSCQRGFAPDMRRCSATEPNGVAPCLPDDSSSGAHAVFRRRRRRAWRPSRGRSPVASSDV